MKERVLFLIRTYLWTVVVFIVAKLAFMFFCHEGHEFAHADIYQVISHGLSLDLSTALYFVSLPFLLVMVSLWISGRWIIYALRVYFMVISFAFALAFVADTSLYPFWEFKLDASCLQYLDTPTEAMASVTTGYIIWRFIVLLIATVIILIGYLNTVRRLRTVCGKSVGKKSAVYGTIVGILMIPLIVIGIRGGLDESTTNIGQVYFSQNQFLNHSAVNPIFNFFDSLTSPLDDLSQYQFFTPEECQTIADGVYTTQSVNCDTLLTTDRPNILVILLESAGEQFASAMPHLQALKTEGVCFTRCYANSWRTDRGTLCALSGYPSLPTLSVMKIPEKSRTMPSIAATLRQQGYHTSYLYGGDINFTNMRSYLVSTGWEHIVSMDDYTLKEQHTSQWGVRDDITFQTIYNQIAGARPGEHYLWGYSTLSSHEPWDVPMKQLDDEVENAFYYLDDCLYRFISRLKKTPQWRDLLIVMMADHGIINGPVDQTTPLQKNHIPMLWLGGAVRQPRVVHTICNQSDLPATLLGQLRLGHDAYPFSRDVLSETYTTPVAVHNYNNAQWICDTTGHVLYDFDLQRVTINASNDAERLQRLDKAMIQLTTTDFQNRK